jgi:uroporphyrinogen decarboxylase
LRFVVS